FGLTGLSIMIIDVFIQKTFIIFHVTYKLNTLVQSIVLPVLALFIIMAYLYLSKKTTDKVKKNSTFLMVSILLMSLSEAGNSTLVNNLVPVLYYTTHILLIVSLSLLYFALIKRDVSLAFIEYYRTEHQCIVHKGPIVGKLYMCSNCNVFYCLKCKDALVKIENKCWLCGSKLVNDVNASGIRNIESVRETEGQVAYLTEVELENLPSKDQVNKRKKI
ncbi:MAG: hypothetical protein ACFFCS_29370, partial [Candidatus Hodarchaeota archaeon]